LELPFTDVERRSYACFIETREESSQCFELGENSPPPHMS